MKKSIVMLGTAFETMGGISAVVNVYRATGLFTQWPIEYVATHRDGSWLDKLEQACKALLKMIALLMSGRVGLLHVHTASGPSFWRKVALIMMARAFGVKYIYHVHGGFFPEFYKSSNVFTRRLIRNVFQGASTVIVLSEEWKSWVSSTFSCSNIQIVANSVAIPATQQNHDLACLLFLGRLGQNKGIYELLQAIANLAPEFPALHLLAGGDGELDEVRAKAQALGIADRVQVLGWITGDAKAALLARAAIYVLPSHAENLPMSILEAMAAGLPVISTPVGGIPSAIEHGVEGLLIAPGDVEALTAAIRNLLLDDALRQSMGEAARHKAIANFAAEKVMQDLGNVYREFGFTPHPQINPQTNPSNSPQERAI